MTWDEVRLKIVFWGPGAWVPNPVAPPSAAIDKVIERYGVIRIGNSDGGGVTIRGSALNDGYFLIDSDDTPHDHWLTPDGHWVESSLSISLLHEIMHLGWEYDDPPHWRGVENQPTYAAIS